MICLFLNLLILIIFAWEANNNYAALEDKTLTIKDKRHYIIRLIIASLTTATALFILYNISGIDSTNLLRYAQTGSI